MQHHIIIRILDFLFSIHCDPNQLIKLVEEVARKEFTVHIKPVQYVTYKE